MSNYKTYIEQNKKRFVTELCELLKIPSISAQEEHKVDILKCAQTVKAYLDALNPTKCDIMPTGGHPVVYAEYKVDQNKPTVLIYGHYDVQAPDPLEEWKSNPFEPVIIDEKIYGRGTSDNKGQFFAHLKALETLLKVDQQLPVNIKVLIEGEEEIDGENLDNFIKNNKELIKADICLIADTEALSSTQPVVTYGLRGLVYIQLDLQVLTTDVHSGIFGGNVPNAAIELSNIIAKLKDPTTQEITIPGFYDNVRVLSQDEHEELQNSPYNETYIKEHSGAKTILGVQPYNIAERMGARPTLDVNGMNSGYIGEGAKTIIPAKASAKISMRLVPNQNSEHIKSLFTEYIKKIAPDYVDVKMTILSLNEPTLMDIHSKYFKIAERASIYSFGNKPIYDLCGGSIPVTYAFSQTLGIDSILLGYGLPDDGIHSPNEKINLEMFYKGIETSINFLKNLEELD